MPRMAFKNGSESDVDCGGTGPDPRCVNGKHLMQAGMTAPAPTDVDVDMPAMLGNCAV